MSEVEMPKTPKLVVKHVQPTLCLDTTDMPEVADYDVGQTYDAVVHCEMIGKRAPDTDSPYSDDVPGVIKGVFKVISIKPVNSTSNSGNARINAVRKAASKY